MISKLRSPIFVQVEITSDCNNNCMHCYNFWNYLPDVQKRKSLSITELKLVSKILGKNDVFYVTITGGEPFIRKDKFYRFVEFLQDQNIRIMVNSNATLLNEEDGERLADSHIEIFLVSLNSLNPQRHNLIAGSDSAFENTIRGIKILQKHKINTAVNMVASKLNYEDIYLTGKWLYDNFGIENFSATPICPSCKEHYQLELNSEEILKSLEQLISLRKELGIRVDILEVLPTCLFTDYEGANIREIVKVFSKRMCTAGNTTITIGSEGDARVCSFARESYGNILDENFKKIWNRMRKWRDDSLLPLECRDCVIVDSCGGGCKLDFRTKNEGCKLASPSKAAIKEKQDIFFSEILEISMDEQYSFSGKVHYREERKDLFILAINPMYFIITNQEGLKLTKHLIGLDFFTPNTIIKSLGLDYNNSKKFFAELLNKGFLKPLKGARGWSNR